VVAVFIGFLWLWVFRFDLAPHTECDKKPGEG
jgi:hypothetical protein